MVHVEFNDVMVTSTSFHQLKLQSLCLKVKSYFSRLKPPSIHMFHGQFQVFHWKNNVFDGNITLPSSFFKVKSPVFMFQTW